MLKLLRRLLPELECELVVCQSRGRCRHCGSVCNDGSSVPTILSVRTYKYLTTDSCGFDSAPVAHAGLRAPRRTAASLQLLFSFRPKNENTTRKPGQMKTPGARLRAAVRRRLPNAGPPHIFTVGSAGFTTTSSTQISTPPLPTLTSSTQISTCKRRATETRK